ncbi:hypothetical protein ABID82_000670 [Methylobacterium sp. PvP062]|jgi:hypothetical protein|uniref:Uncharacterized protein n=1 Tax=Methylobacterium radiotolerans TaxID=31998 RepID=A0ABV2NI55_9HYPH|nr:MULTISPECIES: hypothetical protein [Methylobacterium]MCX7333978.1 hypothetical protein [Hyphomicrobiales bacterium]GAN51678.1 hypothetical protein ME121_5765 [Methylobacterium sp. ME121]KZB97331.1 hypothetical protein AU375_06525 [Methylobacterium radiotolerans]MBN6820072.1 hypothetical protein [Methylobacterium organophilum]MBP2497153.1 hypothetical protein [Methylobacterium sp. PvP105]
MSFFARLASILARIMGGLGTAVGYGLQVPGALLRSVFPNPALTPRRVADDAVAEDDATDPGFNFETPGFGLFVQHAAQALKDGGEAAFAEHVPHISEPVADWLRSLNRAELAKVCKVAVPDLTRHVAAKTVAEGSPLLPSYVRFVEQQSAAEARRTVEIAVMAAKARTSFKTMEAEVAAMAKRGPRPIAEPTWDERHDLGGARPAFR